MPGTFTFQLPGNLDKESEAKKGITKLMLLHMCAKIIFKELTVSDMTFATPSNGAFRDSCLEGAGGYLIHLGYCWHLPFPEEVIQQTLKHKKDNKDGLHISNNILEFITVIINYCASLHVFITRSITRDLHPVLLNVTNNSCTLSWTNHTCRKSKLGRLLAQFSCSLLINSPLGINSQWISTDDNKIADDISQIKRHCLTHFILLTITLCARCTQS
jgi:hypothetical protein